MPTLADRLKPTVDKLRGIAGKLGFRPFTVKLVTRTYESSPWNDDGYETRTVTDIRHDYLYNPKVKIVTNRTYLQGANDDVDVEVGPLTPSFIGADGYEQGMDYDSLAAMSQEGFSSTYFIIDGPGINNARFELVSFKGDRALGFTLQLKRVSSNDD
jgi:hypothetical protein